MSLRITLKGHHLSSRVSSTMPRHVGNDELRKTLEDAYSTSTMPRHVAAGNGSHGEPGTMTSAFARGIHICWA